MVKAIRVKIKKNQPESIELASIADKTLSTGNMSKPCNISQALDNQLCKMDFCERVCLVKTDDDDKLWPALKFDSINELQARIKNGMNISASELAQLRLMVWKISISRSIKGKVAYLLGRGELSSSLAAVDEDKIHDFCEHAIQDKSMLGRDEGLNRAYSIVMDRIDDFTNHKRKPAEQESDSEAEDVSDQTAKRQRQASLEISDGTNNRSSGDKFNSDAAKGAAASDFSLENVPLLGDCAKTPDGSELVSSIEIDSTQESIVSSYREEHPFVVLAEKTILPQQHRSALEDQLKKLIRHFAEEVSKRVNCVIS